MPRCWTKPLWSASAAVRRRRRRPAGERPAGCVETPYSSATSTTPFAQAALERGRKLGESLAQVEAQIEIATDEMAEAFQELKRYELAEEERQKRERDKQKRKDAAMLDETALVGFRRRQAEEEAAGG